MVPDGAEDAAAIGASACVAAGSAGALFRVFFGGCLEPEPRCGDAHVAACAACCLPVGPPSNVIWLAAPAMHAESVSAGLPHNADAGYAAWVLLGYHNKLIQQAIL